MDLVVTPGPGVPHGLVIPGSLLTERFSRSPGPGGQSVNTTDTRVEIEIALADLEPFLSRVQRERLHRTLPASGSRLVAVAHEHRSQHRNRVTARERLAEALRTALAPPPPPRRATKPTRASRERRLAAKRQRAETKAGRSRPTRDS